MPYSTDTARRLCVEGYKAGQKITFLALRYKLSASSVRDALRKAGVPLRPFGFDKRVPFDEPSMVRDYLAGDAVLALAAKYSVQRATIVHRLKERKIKIRTGSEQSYISAARQSPQERLARTAAAHAAVRGSKRRPSVAFEMALKRQIRASMTDKEAEWWAELVTAGIVCVPQYAVGKYSIDLAIPDARIAIEVNAGWSHYGAKGEHEKIRTEYLASLGWLVINLGGSTWRPGWTQKIEGYLQQRRAMLLMPAMPAPEKRHSDTEGDTVLLE